MFNENESKFLLALIDARSKQLEKLAQDVKLELELLSNLYDKVSGSGGHRIDIPTGEYTNRQ